MMQLPISSMVNFHFYFLTHFFFLASLITHHQDQASTNIKIMKDE